MKRLGRPRLEGIKLKPRDRRALKLGALVLGPVLFFTHGVRPYLGARAELVERLETERASYERELRLLADSERFPELRQQAVKGLEHETGRLFEGPNDASAGAALAAFVETRARESEVHLQGVQTLATDSIAGGLMRLRVELQGMSDLEGVLRLLAALEGGDKLISVEELRIERREGFVVSPPAVARTQPPTELGLAATVPGGADPADPGPGPEAASSTPTVLSVSAVVTGYTTVPGPTEEPVGEPLAARDR
ncbi:MAG: GspMb/PilO family protein [Gemmatimonadota bacterium]